MLTSIRNVKFIKMRLFTMFITAVCVLFLIELRWPKNKSLYEHLNFKNRYCTCVASATPQPSSRDFLLISSTRGNLPTRRGPVPQEVSGDLLPLDFRCTVADVEHLRTMLLDLRHNNVQLYATGLAFQGTFLLTTIQMMM